MQHQQQIQTQNQQLFSLQQQLVSIQNNYTELYARTSGEKQAELQQQIGYIRTEVSEKIAPIIDSGVFVQAKPF